MTAQEERTIEDLLKKPYWVIDILPCRVPPDSKGQFFAIEKYYSDPVRMSGFRRKMADVLLKLNCYYGFRVAVGKEFHFTDDPLPDALAKIVAEPENTVMILLEEERSLITLDRGDLYAAVYHPSKKQLALLKQLSVSSGLFLWKPSDQTAE